jgi:hypothetical protein
MGFSEDLAEIRKAKSALISNRDYWACVQACYDAGQGQLCADQCLHNASAEVGVAVKALFVRYDRR